MNGTARKLQLAIGSMAIIIALTLAMGVHGASALTIGTDNGGWTPDNFRSSCKAAGGRTIEIDEGDIKYSKCVFPDGSVNKCDWIKKICTFGIVAGPFKNGVVNANAVNGTLTTTTTSGTGTAGTSGTTRTTSGALFTTKDR